MLSRIYRKLVNRRKESERVPLALRVQTTDSDGQAIEMISEDISETGIRLHFKEWTIADLLGQREEIPLEVFMEAEVPPVKLQARLVWAFNAGQGGSVCGWQFLEFKGRSLRRFRNFIGRTEGGDLDEEG